MNPQFLVDQCYDRLPDTMKAKPWEVTEHGCRVLQTEEELDAYIAAYGEMHIVKCRAALQNFPFQDLKLYSYEIFDWGCGQGLATMTLLDMLRARGLLSHLRCIYLIEPSEPALNRATEWVKQFAGPGVKVVAVNRFIPGDEQGELPEVQCASHASINLFSNILDIRSVSLAWLAQKTASLALTNYQICIGPQFSLHSRIADYCGYFNPQEYFSQINRMPYAYTSRTHHAFGCETRCFLHRREHGLVMDYRECADDVGDTDPYDVSLHSLQGIADELVVAFYNQLRKACGETFNVFFRANINCDLADFVLISKSKGIVLINVCPYLDKLKEAFDRVETIKDNLFSLYLKKIKIDSIIFSSVYNCVKLGLFFPHHSEAEVLEKIKELTNNCHSNEKGKSYQYLQIFTPQSDVKKQLSGIRCRGFKFDYYEELVNLISASWHSYAEEDTNFRLSEKQRAIVESDSKRQRVKGVAGCGKTQVVANRAVYRHLQTGDRVLILTYNISLIQYIRMRINQVPADFLPSMFEVINYHQFFKSKAHLYMCKNLTYNSFDYADFFKDCKDKIQKYQTIIIDEVQDFKPAWLQLITNYFLAKGGSISLFGDGEQNIYNRELEATTKMPTLSNCGFPGGAWQAMNERISMRIINPNIAKLSSKFAHEFLDSQSPISVQEGNLFNDYKIKYWAVSQNTQVETVVSNILWMLQEYDLDTRNVVVLGPCIEMLRKIDDVYKRGTGLKTMLSFETKEEFEELRGPNQKIHFLNSISQKNLEEVRRAAKTHFTTDCPELKLSTIHSFKGWESDTIILLLQSEDQKNECGEEEQNKENVAALIYTAMTRAKCNLFILNIGNMVWHSFFRKNV